MLDLKDLDPEQFVSLGIMFGSNEDAERFAGIIREEGEVRIGERISKLLAPEALEEFDSVIEADPPSEVVSNWFADHSIDAESIIKQVEDELEEELILNRHKIEGALFTLEIKRDLSPVSELIDNEKIRRDLENEGIKRAADILGKRPEELPRSARAHLKPLRERLIAHYCISVNDPMLRLPFFGKKG